MSSIKKVLASIEEKVEYTPILEKSSGETSSISEDGFDDSIPFINRHRQSTARRYMNTTLKAFIVVLAVAGAALMLQAAVSRVLFISQGRFVPSLSPSCSCGGTTVAEAKRRGCVISPMAISWLPPHCIDQELVDQFDRAGPGPNGEWDYWSDINKTRRLTLEEIGELADQPEETGVFYATQEWHVMHCVYTWQKHYRARWTGVAIERRSNGLDHIAHCAMIIRMRDDLQAIATVAGISLDADDPGDDGFHGEHSKGDKFEVGY